jgi:hypothetical protein
MGRKVLGPLACVACHLQGLASVENVDPRVKEIVGEDFLKNAATDNWILGNEWHTWSAEDRHAQAYTTLLGERSVRIGRIMGIEAVHRDPRCLACHATLPASTPEPEGREAIAVLLKDDRVDQRLSLGVSCEACHGAAGSAGETGPAGWIQEHVDSRTWRFKSSQEKQSEFGYYDVRSPSSRTRMCLSCHLGDASQGRLVTHEMYAAGHPPLPSFEVEAFSRMMPAHWRDLVGTRKPKPTAVAAEFLEKTDEPYFRELRKESPELMAAVLKGDEPLMLRTRTVAVGALVSYGANAELTRALISDAAYPLLTSDNRWPEFAQFECYACHHELQHRTWRRQRTPGMTPGRPLLRDWPSPLCLAVIRALAPDEDEAFRRSRDEIIMAAATVQPYGIGTSLELELDANGERATKLAQALEQRPFRKAEAHALLQSMAQVGAEEYLEYDSARELVWACTEVLDELDPDGQLMRARERLKALREPFALDLAAERVRKKTPVDLPGAGARFAYQLELASVLPKAAEYSASAMKEAFAELATAILEPPPKR